MHQLPFSFYIVILIIALWSIIWKIYAVWIACKNDHKKWFVVLLLLNTASILEIIYVFKVAKKSGEEVKKDFRQAWESKK